jgi:apolipoprotein N-acyltransferase
VPGGFPYGDEVGEILRRVAKRVDLIVYPHTLTSGIVKEDNHTGVWLSSLVSTTTSVAVWNTTIEDGGLRYDEIALWRDGEKSIYRKHALYALSDYSPWWARMLGLEKNPYALTPGDPSLQAFAGDIPVGGLICSELHQPRVARREARRSSFLLAVGSDMMFPNDLSGEYSLAAARYRAAENQIFVVRGNILGPSAIINPDGTIQSMLPYGTSGVLYGEVGLTD